MFLSTKMHVQRRALGLTHATLKRTFTSLANKLIARRLQDNDAEHCVNTIRQHDPAGFLPGLLLPNAKMQLGYLAVRSFWVETGLRFGSTAKVAPNSTPQIHLDWWQTGVDQIFENPGEQLEQDWDHPTIRLLQRLLREGTPLTKSHFDDILTGRRIDLDVKQYNTLEDLIQHAKKSCGNLSELVLECGELLPDTNPNAHEAARLVGVCHGLTNALRTSIPVVSITGKLIIPADLTQKYGVRNPRYLLSALGQGDQKCAEALQSAVQDIVAAARQYLLEARALRREVLAEPRGEKAVSVMLPGLASETFLDRLANRHFQLTDRNLRNVGLVEHFTCAFRMVQSYYAKNY